MGAMATADVSYGQQRSFRLGLRHNHHQEVDHGHHYKRSSQKQRRDLQGPMIVAKSPLVNIQSEIQASSNVPSREQPAEVDRSVAVFGLHRKEAYHHQSKSHNQRKKIKHSQQKKSSSHKHSKRDLEGLELHRKRVNQKEGSSHNKHSKRSVEGLGLHRKKANQSSHKKSSSSCNKHGKRDVQGLELHPVNSCLACQKKAASLKKNKRAFVNEDTELAFHRKISRSRKLKVLGQGNKSSKKAKNVKRELIKTQDIKEKESKQGVSRKASRAHKN